MIGFAHTPIDRLRKVPGLLVLSLILLFYPSSSYSQDSLKIAAVVNDEVISAFDLQARTMLVIILSKLPRNQQSMQRLAPQVLRSLIDEKLKLQEAEKSGIEVSQEEITNALARVESVNGYQQGQLVSELERLGIGADTLLEQIRSEIAWSLIVPRKYAGNVQITNEDIANALAEEREKENQPRYKLFEIALAVDKPENASKVRAQALQLVEELEAGAKFESLARAFSQTPTAARGGELDWLRLSQLPEPIRPHVQSLRPGQLAGPIAMPGGFMIIRLSEIKEEASTKASPILNLSQFHLDLPAEADTSVVQSYIDTALKHTQDTDSCSDLEASAADIASPASGNLGDVALPSLPSDLANIVDKLPLNTPSKPVRTSNSVIVLMVCNRTNPDQPSDEAERRRIENRLFAQRINVYARQAIRDLRRNAFIDIR